MDNRRTWKARESGGVRVMQMVRDEVALKYFAYHPAFILLRTRPRIRQTTTVLNRAARHRAINPAACDCSRTERAENRMNKQR